MSAAVRCDGCGTFAPWPLERRNGDGVPYADGDMPRGWARVHAHSGRHMYDSDPFPGMPADVCSPACGERVIGRALHAHRDRLREAEFAAEIKAAPEPAPAHAMPAEVVDPGGATPLEEIAGRSEG